MESRGKENCEAKGFRDMIEKRNQIKMYDDFDDSGSSVDEEPNQRSSKLKLSNSKVVMKSKAKRSTKFM